MNNPPDNGSPDNLDALLNNLIQSFDIDPHPQPIPEPTQHHGFLQDLNGYNSHHPDPYVSDLGGNGEYYQGLHPSFISDLNFQTPELQINGTDLEAFNPYQHPEQTDYSTSNQSYHDSGIEYHDQQQSNFSELQTFNYLEKGDSNSVHFYADGDIYWDSGGKAGHIEGQKFYNSHDYYIGRLGADLKVYNAHDKCVGWVDAEGHAYTLDGAVFAKGGTARWAAAVLIYNTCSPA